MTRKPPHPPVHTAYRRGDLRRALLGANIELVRTGGPEATVLREVIHRVGVAPNTAYRHFAGWLDLLQVVCIASLAALAHVMEVELESIGPVWPADVQTRVSLRAVGTGYLRLAQMGTGLFCTAFTVLNKVESDAGPAEAGNSGRNLLRLLDLALDRMTAIGVLSAERRPGVEYLAWSTAYGLALLIIDGPLRNRPSEQTGVIVLCVVEMAENNL